MSINTICPYYDAIFDHHVTSVQFSPQRIFDVQRDFKKAGVEVVTARIEGYSWGHYEVSKDPFYEPTEIRVDQLTLRGIIDLVKHLNANRGMNKESSQYSGLDGTWLGLLFSSVDRENVMYRDLGFWVCIRPNQSQDFLATQHGGHVLNTNPEFTHRPNDKSSVNMIRMTYDRDKLKKICKKISPHHELYVKCDSLSMDSDLIRPRRYEWFHDLCSAKKDRDFIWRSPLPKERLEAEFPIQYRAMYDFGNVTGDDLLDGSYSHDIDLDNPLLALPDREYGIISKLYKDLSKLSKDSNKKISQMPKSVVLGVDYTDLEVTNIEYIENCSGPDYRKFLLQDNCGYQYKVDKSFADGSTFESNIHPQHAIEARRAAPILTSA